MNTQWHVATELPALGDDEVHVWKVSVAAWASREPELQALLDDDEHARASRFHFARDRQQYVVAHALLRRLLAHYAGTSPRALRFGAGPAGKPYLIASGNTAHPQFNLSHSGDLVLIAVTDRTPVGVDIERWSDSFDPLEVADHFFSPGECAQLRRLTGGERTAGFFACWSRKESYIKATGLGVSEGLDYFDVVVAAGQAGQLLADRRAAHAADRWRMIDIDPSPGYAAALVVERSVGHPSYLVLEPE